jgi:hypothetical protein
MTEELFVGIARAPGGHVGRGVCIDGLGRPVGQFCVAWSAEKLLQVLGRARVGARDETEFTVGLEAQDVDDEMQEALLRSSHLVKTIERGVVDGLYGCVARRQQMRVRYARCVDLLDDLYAGLADGTYPKRLRGWATVDLLVVDDVGLGQVRKRDDEPTAAHTLNDLIDRRHGKTSTALTSNIKLSAWGKYLGDVHLAVATLDRLAMNALRIDIDGPSYRQHVAEHDRTE